ncbi:MAG TPA: hypothetical protein GXZ52_08160 [Clostridiales bacterium]|nr:hypothetical protein [Clostridiales bacterium]
MKKEEMKRALGEVEGYIAAIQELLGSNAAAKITESTFKGAINDTAKMMGAQDEQEAAYYWMGDNYADMAAIVKAAYIMAKEAYNKIQPLYFVADKIIPDDPQ